MASSMEMGSLCQKKFIIKYKKMKAKTALLITMMAFGSFAVKAQQDTTKLYPKIEQLFTIINMEQSCTQAANATADQTIANAPQLAGKKDEARAFFLKQMGYASRKNDLIRMYAKHYTTEEIEMLIAFYQSSAGKKFIATSAQIQFETAELMREKLQEGAGELNKLLPGVQ